MKKILISLLLLAYCVTVSAVPVSVQKAQAAAANFWAAAAHKPCGSVAALPNTGFAQLYVFDIDGGQGFVIVAADDCAYPVLGYSLENPATEEMGANVRFWLGQYEEEIAYRASAGLAADDYVSAAWAALSSAESAAAWWDGPHAMGGSPRPAASSVAPLLTTTWNQSPYYNDLCPSGTPAGCTAIAMAQVMKFWNYPPKGTGSHTYSLPAYGSQSANFGNTTYNWGNMPNALTSSSTSAQKSAVATLCYHVGVSVNMQYNPSGSAAALVGRSNSAQSALPAYFGYDPALGGIYKSQYTDAAWTDTLKGELTAGRPVLYAGYDASSGHAFVFDGYNTSSQFHVNWGWGGGYNGYYSIGALNPGGGGTGSTTTNTFNLSNQAVVGIRPLGRLRLSEENAVMRNDGTAVRVTVFSNSGNAAAWTATASQDWLTLSPATGSGNGAATTLTLTGTANTTGSDRFATVTVVQGTDTARLMVGQLACAAGDMCTLKVNMTDRSSDGWEGASLTLAKTNGLVYGTATISGSYGVQTFSVCPDTVVVTWQRGTSDGECGFFIDNADGAVWVSHTAGSAIAPGVIATLAHPCDTAGAGAPVRYTLTGSINIPAAGTIEGVGEGMVFGSTHTLKAVANDGYRFVRWADNAAANPRKVVVTGDATYTAVFATTGGDTLRYDNGVYNTALGITGGFYWGVKFPASNLIGRPRLEGMQFYTVYGGAYQITVSEGGSSKPTTQLLQGTVNVGSSQTGWVTVTFGDDGIPVTPNKPVWITLYAPQVSYPAAMTDYWCGTDNSCLISTNGSTWRSLHDAHSRWNSWLVRLIAPASSRRYAVTLTVSDTAAGRVYMTGTDTVATAAASFLYGEKVVCGAVANPGYRFVRWRSEAARNPYAFFAQDDVEDEAVFAADPVGVDEPQTVGTPQAVLNGRLLTVAGAEASDLSVYDLMGRMVYHAAAYDGAPIALPAAGVYLVVKSSSAAGRQTCRVAAF